MDRSKARKRAEELVLKMTLEERASQLKYDAPAIPRLGIPAYNWWNEALHGVARAGQATIFPQAIGLGASFDEDMVYEIAEVIAEEGRAKYNAYSRQDDRDIYKGLTFWAPNVNIFRDPRWGRGHETYGEDPYLTARLGVKFVQGLQGEGPVMKAAACAKHFAVHSGPEALRHEFNAKASAKDMEETYLPAFEALVFINLNYREAISIEQLAQMAHLSRSYFMYCFKKMVGISAMEYIIQLRIKLACEMLRNSTAPSLEIAFACGFQNLSNFNRQFKKYVGYTPKQYRGSTNAP